MAVSIGPRIQVDGEEEYRRQINAIIQQSKTLDAEMSALTASFEAEDTAQGKAAKSAQLLGEQLETARRRTDLIREMTEKSAAATGENSTQTLKWRQALANAEEQQYKLEHAVRENTAAIEGQGDAVEENGGKMSTLGEQVQGIADKFGVKIPDSAKQALDGIEGLSSGTVVAMGAVAASVAAAVKAVEALYDMAAESAEKVDALNTRSAKTGLDAALLQKLDYAQRFLDFENLDSTLVKVTQNMAKARDGAEKQAAAFEALGISVVNEDGTLRDNFDTFLDVIDALGQVENATERDVLANDIFGKSYSDLKPLVDAGTDALTDYMQKAEDLGIVLDEEEREKLQRLSDVITDNEARWDALKDRISLVVAPVFSWFIDKINDVITALTNLGDWIDDVGQKFDNFFSAIANAEYKEMDRSSLYVLVRTMCRYAVSVLSVVTVLVLFTATLLVRLFLDGDPAALRLAARGLRLFSLCLVPCALNTGFKFYY